MMEEELKTAIVERLERLRADIVAAIEENGITASGRTQRSLQVVEYNGGVKLIAQAGNRAPIATLEIGRPAGNVPGGFVTTKAGVQDVSKTFKAILIQWGKDKGIDITWGGATMLGRKIAEQGTERHRNPVDVYSTLCRQAGEDLSGYIMATIKEEIKRNF